MRTENYAELIGNGNNQPVFEGIKIRAELHETLATTTITQTYRNAGSKNIEAVYTFPLPLDAVLLEMEVTLGEKTLKGTVLAKKKAEQRYEDAITDGDAPVMLQNPQPGLYTMNVGNLLPGETAKIKIRYALFQQWQGDTLRYHLPTNIAPRYGSPEKAGLEPQQSPESSILVDNCFTFKLKLMGRLSNMEIESPSHSITVDRESEKNRSVVKFSKKSAFMDRDIIITVKKDAQAQAFSSVENDNGEYLVWGSFQPQFGLSEDSSPRSIKIVVDCSGSMGGDSIDQARVALNRIIDELRPQDYFNIILFGDSVKPLFENQHIADSHSLLYARNLINNLDANMGGTEIGMALDTVVRLRCPKKIEQDVLLITDGEIWEWEKVVKNAVKSKHRFFTIGVGSAVSEAFVKSLAEQTGGACELVSPTENMAERIHCHFKRIATPRSSATKIAWPVKPLRVFPEILPSIYDGDTVNLFAWFKEPPKGEIQLQVSLPNGSRQVLASIIETYAEENESEPVISRMVAAYKLREITDGIEAEKLAVKYQLVSKWTNYIAVVVRADEEKADTLPELEKVQQMQTAGWGGSGSVLSRPTFQRDCSGSANVTRIRPSVNFIEDDEDSYDVPTFLRRCVDDVDDSVGEIKYMLNIDGWADRNETAPSPAPPEICCHEAEAEPQTLDQFVETINKQLENGKIPKWVDSLSLPANFPLLLDELLEQIDIRYEEALCIIFLHYLTTIPIGEHLSKQAKRKICKAYKNLQIGESLLKGIENRLSVGLSEFLLHNGEGVAF